MPSRGVPRTPAWRAAVSRVPSPPRARHSSGTSRAAPYRGSPVKSSADSPAASQAGRILGWATTRQPRCRKGGTVCLRALESQVDLDFATITRVGRDMPLGYPGCMAIKAHNPRKTPSRGPSPLGWLGRLLRRIQAPRRSGRVVGGGVERLRASDAARCPSPGAQRLDELRPPDAQRGNDSGAGDGQRLHADLDAAARASGRGRAGGKDSRSGEHGDGVVSAERERIVDDDVGLSAPSHVRDDIHVAFRVRCLESDRRWIQARLEGQYAADRFERIRRSNAWSARSRFSGLPKDLTSSSLNPHSVARSCNSFGISVPAWASEPGWFSAVS